MLRAPRLRRHVLDRAGGSRAPPDAGVPSAASQRRLLEVGTSPPGHGLAVSTCEVPATLSREYRFCPSNAWRVPRSVAALRVLSLSPGLPGTPRTAPDTFARCTDTVRALLQSARERGDGTVFVGVEAQCPSQPGIIQGVLTIRTSGSLSTHDRKSLRPRPGRGGPGRTCRAQQQQHRPGELCADTRTGPRRHETRAAARGHQPLPASSSCSSSVCRAHSLPPSLTYTGLGSCKLGDCPEGLVR